MKRKVLQKSDGEEEVCVLIIVNFVLYHSLTDPE